MRSLRSVVLQFAQNCWDASLILRRLPRQWRLGVLFLTAAISLTVLVLKPPIYLGPSYHYFVDQRALLGLPNCLNVISNVPFLVVGALALHWLTFRPAVESFVYPFERLPYVVFFAGVFVTGIGSFWYHLKPSDVRLSGDLLPMTCSFMSITVAVIMERVHPRAGLLLLPPMLAFGVASVLTWQFGGISSHRDYRFYLFVQFFPPLLLALLVALFPPRYTRAHLLVLAFVLFVVAKLFEANDKFWYVRIDISGHSLKHITAAISCYCILLALEYRRTCRSSGERTHACSALPSSELH